MRKRLIATIMLVLVIGSAFATTASAKMRHDTDTPTYQQCCRR